MEGGRIPLVELDPSLASAAHLNRRINEILNDPSQDIAESVVLSLGAFERFYFCWKTSTGEYEQASFGLPEKLHDWLFNQSSDRDFASLQVVLGQRDEFHAYDNNGKLSSSMAPETPKDDSKDKDKPLPSLEEGSLLFRPLRRRRTLVAREGRPPSAGDPTSTNGSEADKIFRTPRLRGASLDASSPVSQDGLTASPEMESPPDMSQTWKARDRGSYGKDTKPPLSRFRSESIRSVMSDRNSFGSATSTLAEQTPTNFKPTSPPTYADAGVQTSPVECLCSHHHQQQPQTNGGTEPSYGSMHPRASSASDVYPATPFDLAMASHQKAYASPVVHGAMTGYLRQRNYRLGDMLRRPTYYA